MSFFLITKTMSCRVAHPETSTKLVLWKNMVRKRRSLQEPVGTGERGNGIGVREDEGAGRPDWGVQCWWQPWEEGWLAVSLGTRRARGGRWAGPGKSPGFAQFAVSFHGLSSLPLLSSHCLSLAIRHPSVTFWEPSLSRVEGMAGGTSVLVWSHASPGKEHPYCAVTGGTGVISPQFWGSRAALETEPRREAGGRVRRCSAERGAGGQRGSAQPGSEQRVPPWPGRGECLPETGNPGGGCRRRLAVAARGTCERCFPGGKTQRIQGAFGCERSHPTG